MAAKPENIATFYGNGYGFLKLVKKSIGKYTEAVWLEDQYGKYFCKKLTYWRGQLVVDFIGFNPKTNERWDLRKGQVIWLDADRFHPIPAADYIEYTNI